MDSVLIGEYVELKRRSNKEAARALLLKIGNLVEPIQKKHKLKVKSFREMFPKNNQLLGLNVNRGARIHIRLRYPHNESMFIPIDQLIDTMLHELVHNTIGPHDDRFHKLWNEYRAELEGLMSKGWNGSSFQGSGKRLGVGIAGQSVGMPGPPAARAASAAAKRAQFPSFNGKLGGAVSTLPLAELVRQSAMRRFNENRWCPSQDEIVELDDEDEGISVVKIVKKRQTKAGLIEREITPDSDRNPQTKRRKVREVIDMTSD